MLEGTVALVAGATRGAGRGIACELGAAGATVYVTGRTTRERRSEYGRPETIEETAELVTAPGGRGIAVQRRPSRSPTRSARWSSASAPSRGVSTSWSTTSGAARSSSSGTSRSGSTISTNGLRMLRLAHRHAPDHGALRAAAADPNGRAGCWSRSPTAPPTTMPTTTGSRRSTTWRRSR